MLTTVWHCVCTQTKSILIATGGRPRMPRIPGAEFCDTSDTFCEWESQPKSACFVGGGYIAVELAGVLNALGSKVTILARSGILRTFDVRHAAVARRMPVVLTACTALHATRSLAHCSRS